MISVCLCRTQKTILRQTRPRSQWFGNRAIYNKARSFDTSGAADVWLPDFRTGIRSNARGNTGYTLVVYGANEVSTMMGTVTGANKLCIWAIPTASDLGPHRPRRRGNPWAIGPNKRPLGQRGVWPMWAVLSANAY